MSEKLPLPTLASNSKDLRQLTKKWTSGICIHKIAYHVRDIELGLQLLKTEMVGQGLSLPYRDSFNAFKTFSERLRLSCTNIGKVVCVCGVENLF